MHPSLTDCSLRDLESKILYNTARDQQYELDQESYDFLSYCTGKNSFAEICALIGIDKSQAIKHVKYLEGEGCLADEENPRAPSKFPLKPSIKPSLKYLLVHITERCNLNCKHCYLGDKESRDLELHVIARALEEFSSFGLKVLISGGEPLLHKHFWDVLKLAGDLPIRAEILTNGTLVTPEVALGLSKYADQVQISLDGMRRGHEMLRGKGSFKAAVEGIKNAKEFLPVTCATMIHTGNLGEFEELKAMLLRLGVDEWILDIPSSKGNMLKNNKLMAPCDKATAIFKAYGYSAGVHAGDAAYSCGSHMCSIDAHGFVSKCGFFEEPVGNIEDSNLEDCWKRLVDGYLPRLEELECNGCEVLGECRGGCRYRASGSFLGRDPFMCYLYLGEEDEADQ